MFTDVAFFRTQFATYCTSKSTFIPSRRLFTIVQKSAVNVVVTGNISMFTFVGKQFYLCGSSISI